MKTSLKSTGSMPSAPQTLDTQLLEEGAAFEQLNRHNGPATPTRDAEREPERFDVIVIGGGQAGLSVGYHLARTGVSFVILDAHERIGDAWRQRWDSLRLFTPARFCAIDGWRFPASPDSFPTKEEMADYLEAYAARFGLPVRTGVRVEHLTREGDRYVVNAGGRRFESQQVVIAMASYQKPRIPAFASTLDPGIVQLHSADYRRPAQLPPGGVLIVGAGNSGAEIAMDLVRNGHPVWLSGRSPGEVPFRMENPLVRRTVAPIVFRVVFHRLLSVDTPIGRKARPGFISRGTPLIRTREKDLQAAGVHRVGRTEGVRDGKPLLVDGRPLHVSSVVWCTGFHIGASWIQLPVFGEDGEPIQSRGVVSGEPGLYFVGTHFLYAASSAMIHGVGRDARRVVETIVSRLGAKVAA